MKFFGIKAKLLLSAVLIVAVMRNVDFAKLLDEAYSIPMHSVIIVVLGYFVSQTMSAFKWWWLARLSGIQRSYLQVLRSYFGGMFVNLFGLGLTGGDVARALLLAGTSASKTQALATVVADRMQGLAVLALVGLVSALVFGGQILSLQLLLILVAISSAIVLGWVVGPALAGRLSGNRETTWARKLREIRDAFPTAPAPLVALTCVSAMFHLLQIALHYEMMQALGSPVPLTVLLVVIPFVNVLSSLPISWNGVGVREQGYAFFLSQYLSPDQIIACGVLWLGAVATSSCIGGLVALWSGDLSKLKLESEKLRHCGAETDAVATVEKIAAH